MRISIMFLACVLSVASPATGQSASSPAAAAADRKQRAAAIDEFERELVRLYVFPDAASKAVRGLDRERKALLSAATPADFAKRLLSIVKAQTNDVHLYFAHDPVANARLTREKQGAEAAPHAPAEADSYGFSRVEILPGEIGLLQLDRMADVTAESGAKAVAAMALLADSQAIIIDLRRNGGGSGRMNQLISSYFFDGTEDKWLVSNKNRSAGTFVQEWTQPYVPGKRMPETPLYFLIGPSTGSAAEGFAYNLQALGRAIVVGEKSAGGAHSGDFIPIGENFVAFIPSGRTINPITKSNWEGTGVVPDVAVPWSKALAETLRRIWDERAEAAVAGSPEAGLARWTADYYAAKVNAVPLPADINGAVGSYEEGVRILRIGNHLYHSSKDSPWRALLPLANGDFVREWSDYYGPGASRIRFVRDSTGEVVKLQELIRHEPLRVATFDLARVN